MRDQRSLLPDLPLDEVEASRAVSIFDRLRLPDVPGQPAFADAAGDWARDMVRAIFGSLVDGERMVPELFELVPKKNAKTTNGAAIMVVALLMNLRPRAEFVLVGPTQEIADLAFQQASGIIDADPDGYLQKRFQVQEHVKTIVDRTNNARLKVKTFDLKVATGAKPAGVLIDELHLMAGMPHAARVIGQLRGGMIANPEAFLIFITTQSDEPPAGAFKAELDYARAVRDGRIPQGRVLPMLYEFPEAMQIAEEKPWRDPACWPMVLPNLGRSITVDRLKKEFRAAREKGEAEERRWASQHLNIEIGLALHSDRWIGADLWPRAVDVTLSYAELIARSEVIVAGIDGGGLDDLMGLGLIGRCRETKNWLGWGHAWAQPEVFDKRKEIAARLQDFADEGDLTVCEDPTEDIRGLADIIEELNTLGLLPAENAVGLDPQGVGALIDELSGRGIAEAQMIGIAQGFRLSSAVWGLERKLKDGTFVHAPQALMNWCVGNAKTEQRGNAVLITKQTAGKAKIDPLIAMFNAVSLMGRNPVAEGDNNGGLDRYLERLSA
ncbi:terminase large subunit [Flavisphingopyxis soli]|uniref:terminase large subunit n=1 Tax=Flavisphingopyxis soli TaxID=2601267 RepID=UPI001F23B13F|nr:terminase TerL endonuclease subunit [Sphingorhabdus soli]